jgi:hypothetical protein
MMTTIRIVTTRTRTSQCRVFGTVVKVSAKRIRFTSYVIINGMHTYFCITPRE